MNCLRTWETGMGFPSIVVRVNAGREEGFRFEGLAAAIAAGRVSKAIFH
jgi:hypothetical protein